MSQSVLISHPKALNFLERDLTNIIKYFSARGINTPDINQIYEEIIIDFPDKNLID
jgi:serine/threonine-protein kinase RIO1